MGNFIADLRYALRNLRSNAGFTAVAVAALALGIGATTAIFTVVNGVMLAPLPYSQPDRLVRLGRKYPEGNGYSNSIPKYMVWRQNNLFAASTLYEQGGLSMNFGSGENAPQAKAAHVSKDYFQVFGAEPMIGRTFTEAEDLPHGTQVAVLSYRTWQGQMNGDRQVVGRNILLNLEPYTVVGVMPKGFESDPPNDVWLPLQADPNSTNQGHYLAAAARLKPDVTVDQALAAEKVLGERFRAANPKWMDPSENVAVVPMKQALVENVRQALFILLGAVGFVLLIACANVANLLLARAAVRQREFAIRAAMGADKGRVVRQLLTESLVLASIGAVLGFVLGAWGVRALLMVAPGNIPRLTSTDGLQQSLPLVDWRVAGFVLAVSVLTVILFGLFPALSTSNPDLASTLKEGGRSGGSTLRKQARAFLVIAEVALSLMLLTGAALLIRTFAGLRSADPGLKPHNVLVFETSLAGDAYASTAKTDQFVRQVVQRVEGVPSVESATSTIILPLNGNDVDLPFSIVGHPPAKGEYNGDEQWRSISAHYFSALQIPVMRGRVFNDSDAAGTPPVVIVNQAMVKKYWKDQDPIGQVIVIGKGLGPQFDDPPRQVVGVVGMVRETGLNAVDEGVIYIPQSQVPEGMTKLASSIIPLNWAVRCAGDPTAVRAAVARELHAVDPRMTLAHVRPMEEMIAQSLARQNFNMTLLTVFAAIALLLAAIGIYGLISYSVEQRMQEIGIRVALGAARVDVLRLIVWQGMKLTVAGIVIGLVGSAALTRFLESMLFGVKPRDAATFTAMAAVVALVALLASFAPAQRAAGIAPSTALRHQ
jgi:putative ABC transport system permease protein